MPPSERDDVDRMVRTGTDLPFASDLSRMYSLMSAKEIVAGLLERLPEDVSLHEVAREIEFIAAVSEGFESYEREGGTSIEEARESVSSWVKTATR